MALSLFHYENVDDILDYVGVYGVLQEGVTQDQVFYILQNEPDTISEYFDPTYSGISYVEFLALAYGEDVGYIYETSVELDACIVTVVNNGLGGVSFSDRSDDNQSVDYYMISEYEFSSELYASPYFRPTTFLSGVVAPVSAWAFQNVVILAFLAVTFFSVGVRIFRRVARTLGRGR